MNVHFSSAMNDWGTPQWMFDRLNLEFDFTLDPACSERTAKCKKFYTLKDNGLTKSWANERVFLNPPYGREIKAWIRKAREASTEGATVVCLIPARTDTFWFHEYCLGADIRFLRGRIKFENSGKIDNAPFPSMLVIFRPND